MFSERRGKGRGDEPAESKHGNDMNENRHTDIVNPDSKTKRTYFPEVWLWSEERSGYKTSTDCCITCSLPLTTTHIPLSPAAQSPHLYNVLFHL